MVHEILVKVDQDREITEVLVTHMLLSRRMLQVLEVEVVLVVLALMLLL